jgi:hypothetical protein
MRLTRRALVFLLIGVAVPALAACRHGGNEIDAEEWPRLGPIPLHVRNDNFLDMNVAVQSHGVARRLGTVSGNSNANFKIERNMVSPDGFNLVATPIGGNGRASTPTINVGADQEVDFRIAPVLRQSSVMVR